jgi:uncharacterized protein
LIGRASALAEDDCACPDSSPTVTQTWAENVDSGRQITPGLYRTPLPGDHELIFNLPDSAQVVVLNSAVRLIFDAFESPHTLDDLPRLEGTSSQDTVAIVQQLVDLGLLVPPNYQPRPIHSQPDTLTAWLHLTNACNLRCTYCYLHKSAESMTEVIGRQAVDAVFKTASQQGFTSIKLKYAGGEPTLRFELLQALHQQARALAAQMRLRLQEVVLSNGVSLTRSMLDYLRVENIRLAISLDGVGAAHDAQRPSINGHGSFTRVARTIDQAMAASLSPHLSITVMPHNADHLPEAVAFALDRDLSFNLNFARDCEAALHSIDPRNDQDRLIAGLKAALTIIEQRLPRRRLIDGLIDRSAFHAPHEYPCGVGRSYVVIDQRGRVARCQMDLARPLTDVTAPDMLLDLQAQSFDFQNVRVTIKEGCADCTWRYWCAGGCPRLTFHVTGRTDTCSPYCGVYQAIYPEILRLEGLRLLKWGSDESFLG